MSIINQVVASVFQLQQAVIEMLETGRSIGWAIGEEAVIVKRLGIAQRICGESVVQG
jgi:hypothetical protein